MLNVVPLVRCRAVVSASLFGASTGYPSRRCSTAFCIQIDEVKVAPEAWCDALVAIRRAFAKDGLEEQAHPLAGQVQMELSDPLISVHDCFDQ